MGEFEFYQNTRSIHIHISQINHLLRLLLIRTNIIWDYYGVLLFYVVREVLYKYMRVKMGCAGPKPDPKTPDPMWTQR